VSFKDSTRSNSSPVALSGVVNSVCTGRPTIASTTSAVLSDRGSKLATFSPLRSTVARSATFAISSIRCEM
jgi:hypothetical protein